MSYDSHLSYLRPWDGCRGPRPSSRSSSSSFYPARAPPPGKRLLRPGSSSSSSSSFSCASSLPPDGCERMNLSRACSLNTELLGVRSQEREQLVDLNDRFATYIEKVRHLELQNRALLAELDALRRRQGDPSRLQLLYEGEARGLRAAIDSESGEKLRLEAERDHLRDVYRQEKLRLEEEAGRRADAEDALQSAKEEADRAALANCDSEAAVLSLCDELLFLKKVFAEEQAELQAQLQTADVGAEAAAAVAAAARPDLSGALRDIRAQYERLAHKNMQAAEDWYRNKFATVAQMASKSNEAAHAVRQETVEYRRLLQSRAAEIEALRNVIDSLNKQLEELEETQVREVDKYQVRIGELEQDIAEAKREMARYLRDYQDLLNVKMALDIEIAAYRKLLEGEELRLTYPSLPALN